MIIGKKNTVTGINIINNKDIIEHFLKHKVTKIPKINHGIITLNTAYGQMNNLTKCYVCGKFLNLIF